MLWACKTFPRAAIEKTPFSLVYGTKAMVLVKLKIPTHRLKYCDEQVNEEKLKGNLDALEELQDMASIRSTAYQ